MEEDTENKLKLPRLYNQKIKRQIIHPTPKIHSNTLLNATSNHPKHKTTQIRRYSIRACDLRFDLIRSHRTIMLTE